MYIAEDWTYMAGWELHHAELLGPSALTVPMMHTDQVVLHRHLRIPGNV